MALDGLREEVQVDGHRHVGEGRRWPAGEADEQLAEGQADAERGADPQVEEAGALGAAGGAAHARVEQADRGGELEEDHARDRDAHPGVQRDR